MIVDLGLRVPLIRLGRAGFIQVPYLHFTVQNSSTSSGKVVYYESCHRDYRTCKRDSQIQNRVKNVRYDPLR